jgi:hypothetical protein
MVPGGKYLRTNPVKSSVSWDKIHGKKYTQKKISMNKMGDPKIASVHQGTLNPAVLVMFSKKDVLFCRKEARSSSFSSNSDWQSTPPSHWSVPESALTVLVRFAFPSRTSLSKVFVTCQNKKQPCAKLPNLVTTMI